MSTMPAMDETPASSATPDYIQSVVMELEEMAKAENHGFLAYLLAMARHEAEAIVDRTAALH